MTLVRNWTFPGAPRYAISIDGQKILLAQVPQQVSQSVPWLQTLQRD
jgi:hypothetical protein